MDRDKKEGEEVGVGGGGRRRCYLNRYSLCFLNAQQSRVGSEVGVFLSCALARVATFFDFFPNPPWYTARPRKRSVFSTLPMMRANWFVTRLTTWTSRGIFFNENLLIGLVGCSNNLYNTVIFVISSFLFVQY